jgi:hypothetical protein
MEGIAVELDQGCLSVCAFGDCIARRRKIIKNDKR